MGIYRHPFPGGGSRFVTLDKHRPSIFHPLSEKNVENFLNKIVKTDSQSPSRLEKTQFVILLLATNINIGAIGAS